MSDVEDLLNLIKECWPQFQVTKENLLHPSQELVFKFYSRFLSDYNETVSYLTGVTVSNEFIMSDLEPEERLFLHLSRMLEKIHSLKFTLSDIYQPKPLRTKNFFKICIHFIVFTQNLLTERDALGTEVFKTKEDTGKLLMEQEELLNEINENARNKEINERNKTLLDQEYKSIRNSYKEMKDLKANKEKLYAEKKQQIETLKWELQNEEYELKRLETIEKDLLQQKITERDYHNILQTVKTLKTESETLDSDDVNIGDGLVHENEVLQHSADCLRVLNQFDFNVDTVKKLIIHEENLKVVSNTLEKLGGNKLHLVKQQKSERKKKLLVLQECFANLQNEYKDIKERYLNSVDQFSQEISKFNYEIEEKSQSNNKTILRYEEDIKKSEEDEKRLKDAFAIEYIKVSEIESRVVENFSDTIMKYNNLS